MQEAAANLAVLIDGDNASSKVITALLAEIAHYGTASVKRIYGDWTQPNLNAWKAVLLE
ncbi:MAG TPA: NYN domain-containing protein, partial [Asticcacaulis sp.]|nr:NYN domain-containing protein [Asticcacaulis sp.]